MPSSPPASHSSQLDFRQLLLTDFSLDHQAYFEFLCSRVAVTSRSRPRYNSLHANASPSLDLRRCSSDTDLVTGNASKSVDDLPRTEDGRTDWSQLSLVEAFVYSCETQPTSPVSHSEGRLVIWDPETLEHFSDSDQ